MKILGSGRIFRISRLARRPLLAIPFPVLLSRRIYEEWRRGPGTARFMRLSDGRLSRGPHVARANGGWERGMAPASREMRGIGFFRRWWAYMGPSWRSGSDTGLSGPLTLRLSAPNRHAARAMTLLFGRRCRRNHGGTHAGLSGSRAVFKNSERVAFSDGSSGSGLRTHGPRSAGPKRDLSASCLRLPRMLRYLQGHGRVFPC